MDFGELLHFAKKKNDAATKDNEGKFYSTKYAPPKKETNKNKQLSINIQKFLRKREVEEAERKREERQKVAELMAKRDEKSKNKIRKMLKVTKSANKSVLDDAKDIDVMEAECGPDGQPGDGDDYGYVSNEANAFYQKYIEKVRNVHEDKGFAPSRPQSLRDLSGTKERVKAAINRDREDSKTGQRTRTVAPTSSSSSGGSKSSKDPQVARSYNTSKTLYDPDAERRDQERKKIEEEQQRKAKIKRQPQKPPMDFQALLRLAEKKQHEPIVFAQPEKKKEPERLLSAREKREQEERQRQKEQKAQRDRQREIDSKTKDQQPTTVSKMVNGRIPKLSSATAKPSTSDPKAKPSSSSNSTAAASSSSAKTNIATSTKTSPSSKAAVNLNKPASSSSSSSSAAASKPKNPYAKLPENSIREFPPRDRPSNSVPNKTRQFPPTDVRERKPMPSARKPQQEQNRNKRRIYDDDSEYDSELDDFIDDGDCEEDISSHIRDIFGYDKRRYRDIDDDDRGMESSFAQMQREEFISKKLGLQEDLEDMRLEAIHKKRKLANKKTKALDDDDDD
ncbi:protein SPT2 homolog [Drosophila tropicalis]|uniref:protein SPT2 homolog n=1 Tax=Drosophila tropicalis TaxID=46794 RepID=UPI0035ABD45A